MTKQRTPNKAVTPPKGRPTRSRTGRYGRRRVFGPTAQWIAVVVFLLLLFAVLFIITDGGDFNPFNDAAPMIGPLVASLAAWSADPGS